MTETKPAPQEQEEQAIFDLSDLRKYRTELPNLYDDADLDVYEFRLLAHYKRVGICREGLSTTAMKCKMSEGQVSQKRQSLSEKGWITLERIEMSGKRYRYVIRVIDRWIENFAKFSGLDAEEIARQVQNGSPSRGEGSPSRGEGKKELIKNLRDDRFGTIAQKLSEITGGGLNSQSSEMIATWMDNHSDEWIYKAMQIAEDKGARHQNYIDTILVGWEANGYPKTREQKVQGAKNANITGNSKRTKQPKQQHENHSVQYSQADIDAAAKINARVR